MQRSRMILAGGFVFGIGIVAWGLSKDRDAETPTIHDSANDAGDSSADPGVRAPTEITLAPSPIVRPPAGAGAAATEKAAAPAVDAARRVTITERVLAPNGTPISGATVEVRIDDAVAARATSDASGAVSVDVDTPERRDAPALVVTRSNGGLVALRTAWWWSGAFGSRVTRLSKVELGDVKLAEGVSVELTVKDPSGIGTIADVVVTQNWSVTQPVVSIKSAADGRVTVEALAPGPYFAYARSAVGRGTAWFTAPRKTPGPVELVLGELHDVAVTVVEKTTRTPVVAARISVTELAASPDGQRPMDYLPRLDDIPPTDAQGRTKITGVAKGAMISLAASAPGFPVRNSGMFGRTSPTRAAAGATSMEIVLERGRTVSWSLTNGEVPPPPEGTALTLESQAGSGTSSPSGTGRMSGGKIVIDEVPPEPTLWIAFAPDGSQATLYSAAGATEGKETSFLAPRKVDVALHWNDGTPATGLFVSLRNQGNNPMGTPVATDERGAATLDRLESQMADVYVATKNVPFGGRRIASVDLRKGSARVEVALPLRREGTIRVFLDGAAGLPPTIEAGWGAEAEIKARDAATGTLRVLVWPLTADGNANLVFTTPGWLADAPIPVAAGTGPFEGRLDLHQTGSVDVEVVKPTTGRVSLRLDRVDDGKPPGNAPRSYGSDSYGPGQAQIDAEGHWKLPTIAPGRYRVRDSISSTTSDEFAVVAGATATLRFDCSSVGTIEGVVVVPEGESAAGLAVHLVPAPPPDPFSPHGVARTGPDGRFKLTVPGDREVVLTADHLLLVPATDGGSVRVRAGAKDVTIRLVRGPVCALTLDRAPSARPGWASWDGQNPAKVYLWKGAMIGAPTFELAASLEGTRLRFGRYEPGTYSVLIDLSMDGPVILTDLLLGEKGTTVVTPVALPVGSALVFAIFAPTGQSVPRISVNASRVDALPAYQRWGEVADKGRILGLGKGRFRVRASPVMGGASLFDQEVDVDGTSDVDLKIEWK